MRSVITTEAMAMSRSCRCQAVKATAMSATRMSAPGCYRTVKVTRWAPPSRRYGQPRSCEVCAAVLLCAVCWLCVFCFPSPYVAGRRSIYALLCDDASQARSVVCCTVEATCSRCGRYARFSVAGSIIINALIGVYWGFCPGSHTAPCQPERYNTTCALDRRPTRTKIHKTCTTCSVISYTHRLTPRTPHMPVLHARCRGQHNQTGQDRPSV